MDRKGQKPQVNVFRRKRRHAPFHPMKRGIFTPSRGDNRCGTKSGRFWDDIGMLLVLTEDSIYVRLNTLKIVITSENGCERTPRGVFFHAPAEKDSAQNNGRRFRFPNKQQRGNLLVQKTHTVPKRTEPRTEPLLLAVRMVSHRQPDASSVPHGLCRHHLNQGHREYDVYNQILTTSPHSPDNNDFGWQLEKQ